MKLLQKKLAVLYLFLCILCIQTLFSNLEKELQKLQHDLLLLETSLKNQPDNSFSAIQKIMANMRDTFQKFRHQTGETKKALDVFSIESRNKNLSIKEMRESEAYKKIEHGVDALMPFVVSLRSDLEKLIHQSYDNLDLGQIKEVKKFLKEEISDEIDDFVRHLEDVNGYSRKVIGNYISYPLEPITNKDVFIHINYGALKEGQKVKYNDQTSFFYWEKNEKDRKSFVDTLDEFIDLLEEKKKALEGT